MWPPSVLVKISSFSLIIVNNWLILSIVSYKIDLDTKIPLIIIIFSRLSFDRSSFNSRYLDCKAIEFKIFFWKSNPPLSANQE